MKNRKGFTLIELLAVIVILGVIMAIAIPAMTGYIDDSKKDSMVSSASLFIDTAAKKITSENKLPVSGASSWIAVSDLKMTSGGTSPYTNAAYSESSFVIVSNASGVYTYTIYLTDGTNCLVGTESQVNASATNKRGLVKADNSCTAPTKPAGATQVQ